MQKKVLLRRTNVTVNVLMFGLGTQLSFFFTNLGATFSFAPFSTARPDCIQPQSGMFIFFVLNLHINPELRQPKSSKIRAPCSYSEVAPQSSIGIHHDGLHRTEKSTDWYDWIDRAKNTLFSSKNYPPQFLANKCS